MPIQWFFRFLVQSIHTSLLTWQLQKCLAAAIYVGSCRHFFALSMLRGSRHPSSLSPSLHLVKGKVRGPQEIMVSHSLFFCDTSFLQLVGAAHITVSKFLSGRKFQSWHWNQIQIVWRSTSSTEVHSIPLITRPLGPAKTHVLSVPPPIRSNLL